MSPRIGSVLAEARGHAFEDDVTLLAISAS